MFDITVNCKIAFLSIAFDSLRFLLITLFCSSLHVVNVPLNTLQFCTLKFAIIVHHLVNIIDAKYFRFKISKIHHFEAQINAYAFATLWMLKGPRRKTAQLKLLLNKRTVLHIVNVVQIVNILNCLSSKNGPRIFLAISWQKQAKCYTFYTESGRNFWLNFVPWQ